MTAFNELLCQVTTYVCFGYGLKILGRVGTYFALKNNTIYAFKKAFYPENLKQNLGLTSKFS